MWKVEEKLIPRLFLPGLFVRLLQAAQVFKSYLCFCRKTTRPEGYRQVLRFINQSAKSTSIQLPFPWLIDPYRGSFEAMHISMNALLHYC